MITALVLGLILGIMSLIPGLNASTFLVMVLPWLKSQDAFLAIGYGSGISTVLSGLRTVFAPVTELELKRSDSATQMSYLGRTEDALFIWIESIKAAGKFSIVTGLLISLSLISGENLSSTTKLLSVLSTPILCLILLNTVKNSTNKIKTTIIIGLSGYAGIATLYHPGLIESEWSMSPLLNGLYLIPSSLSLFLSGKTANRITLPIPPMKRMLGNKKNLGAVLGILSGFLAGIGTGSLINLWRHKLARDEEQVALGASAEASNTLFSLIAFVTLGMSRSGAAAALSAANVQADGLAGIITCLACGMGIATGLYILPKIRPSYEKWVEAVSKKKLSLALLAMGLGPVLWHTGWLGIQLMTVSWIVSSLARKWNAPNQALLASLMVPLLINKIGGVPLLQLIAGYAS